MVAQSIQPAELAHFKGLGAAGPSLEQANPTSFHFRRFLDASATWSLAVFSLSGLGVL